MILDAQNLYSGAQVLTATAASTNTIDHGAARGLGIGESLSVVITVSTALAGTTPTMVVSLETDDNSAFSSAVTVGTTKSYTALPVGSKIVLALGANGDVERYTRIKYTLGGTTPTATVSAYLIPTKFIQNDQYFPKGYSIA